MAGSGDADWRITSYKTSSYGIVSREQSERYDRTLRISPADAGNDRLEATKAVYLAKGHHVLRLEWRYDQEITNATLSAHLTGNVQWEGNSCNVTLVMTAPSGQQVILLNNAPVNFRFGDYIYPLGLNLDEDGLYKVTYMPACQGVVDYHLDIKDFAPNGINWKTL